MSSVNDWAAKAARRLLDESLIEDNEEHIAAIIATFAEPLVALLREARREHYHDTSGHACCPQCCCHSWAAVVKAQDEGEMDAEPEPNSDAACTCGADAWNARIEKALNP